MTPQIHRDSYCALFLHFTSPFLFQKWTPCSGLNQQSAVSTVHLWAELHTYIAGEEAYVNPEGVDGRQVIVQAHSLEVLDLSKCPALETVIVWGDSLKELLIPDTQVPVPP